MRSCANVGRRPGRWVGIRVALWGWATAIGRVLDGPAGLKMIGLVCRQGLSRIQRALLGVRLEGRGQPWVEVGRRGRG